MLQDLKILNGELSMDFDPLNHKYSVFLNDNNDMELELEYRLEEEAQISVTGNYLDKENSEVVLTVYNEEKMEYYSLYVFKEDTNEVSYTLDNTTSLDVPLKKEISPYAVPGISATCFLLILFLFTFLFHKKKSK